MKPAKRTRMKIEENNGQWHKDVDRLHTYGNRAWTIVFVNSQGHFDKDLGVCVKAEIKVKVMPTKSSVLKSGLVAFIGKGKTANLIMRNSAL